MDEFLNKLSVVIIDQPIDQLNNPIVNDLFTKILELKRKGYGLEYDMQALPMDTTDFFSTHLSICLEEEGELVPICTYKSVSYSKCQEYQVQFSPLGLIKDGGTPECFEKIQSILHRCEESQIDISYDCSWTVDPRYRRTKQSHLLRELALALAFWHHKDFKIPEFMTCGILRMKTDQFFYAMGHRRIGEHALFSHRSLCGEEAVMVHLEKFSDWAVDTAGKYEGLWGRRKEYLCA
jgi:hypothetical protein